ncbi:MAG TPA: DNA mismatch repair protein MutS, partial [Cytophagales bacterium]
MSLSNTTQPETKEITSSKETPLMKQYNLIKARYPGALLLFRVGDFYETFGEDAVKASKILDIVLTKRSNGAAGDVPLAGFPHHSLDAYLPKLVRAGERVAICDQLEDPKVAQGIVKRGVTELVTPGVSFHDNVLDGKRNNYLCALHFGGDVLGISFLDVSTGEFFASQGDAAYIDKLLQSLSPSEVLLCKQKKKDFAGLFGDKYNAYHLDDWVFGYPFAYEKLTTHFQTATLKGFGIENAREGIVAAGCILHYLAETEHHEVAHIAKISRLEEDRYVWLDKFTIRNLELVYPQQEGGVPLLQILDQTTTPMGSRLLRKWVVLPLKEKGRIEERLDTVGFLVAHPDLSSDLLGCIKGIGDLERLISKVAARRVNPRELLRLKRSLQQTVPIKAALAAADLPLM